MPLHKQVYYEAECQTCGAFCKRANSRDWALNHANQKPGHHVDSIKRERFVNNKKVQE